MPGAVLPEPEPEGPGGADDGDEPDGDEDEPVVRKPPPKRLTSRT